MSAKISRPDIEIHSRYVVCNIYPESRILPVSFKEEDVALATAADYHSKETFRIPKRRGINHPKAALMPAITGWQSNREAALPVQVDGIHSLKYLITVLVR
jgi:hypothetical protein